MSRVRIGVYGSLRKGEYNFERFVEAYGTTNIKVLSEGVVIEGYNLYNLGPYPAITKGDNNLTIDVLSVSENVYNSIRAMELGAGYNEESIKIPRYNDVKIYTFKEGSFPKERLVESGNWSEFLKK